MSTPIYSVDELCIALQATLAEHLSAVVEAIGLPPAEYKPVKDWQQLPTVEALATATLPAGAVSSAGLVRPPSLSRAAGGWATTWRIAVGIYDRGRDHDETQARVRNWCAAIRMTVLRHKSLGGLAQSVTWAGEEYALLPNRNQARTIAAGAVAFDVTALVPTTVGDLPPVTSTPTTLSVN